MRTHNISRPIRLGFFIILFISLICLSLWGTARFRLSTTAQSDKQVKKQTMPQREISNLNQLESLVSSNDITVDENALLPARVNRSQTILVRLESSNPSISEKPFATELHQEGELSLLEIKPNQGRLSRQRSFEPSQNEVLIVMVDRNNQVLWWDSVPDPRLLRAESADAAGNISGQTFYLKSAVMPVSYPADERITELRFYHPSWDGESYSLQSIGNLSLASSAAK